MNESCHTYEWVTSHIWVIHVTLMNESRHTYESFMLHSWMSHVTHMSHSCYTHEWVTSHTWTMHVTQMNESHHAYERVMSHVWMGHVTQASETPLHKHLKLQGISEVYVVGVAFDYCVGSTGYHSYVSLSHTHSFMCHMNHTNERHDSLIYVTWRFRMCDMPHSCVWRDSFKVVRVAFDYCVGNTRVGHDSFVCVMTHLWVCGVAFVCISCHARLLHWQHWCVVCDMNYSNVWHDSFVCAAWLIRYMTTSKVLCHSFAVWHDSFAVCHDFFAVWHDSFAVCHDSFVRGRLFLDYCVGSTGSHSYAWHD